MNEASETLHMEEEKSKALWRGRKKKKKQVGREVCMETLLTPATGVLFF